MGASSAEKDFLAKLDGANEKRSEVKADAKDAKPKMKAADKDNTSGDGNKKDASSHKSTNNNEKKEFWSKLPLKKWWFWVIVIVLVGMIFSIFMNMGRKINKVEQVYSELEQPDLNGMKISEACEKVRAIGWKIDEVAGENDYSEKSDCSDTEHTVIKYYYQNEKYFGYSGGVRSDYETVELRFNNAKKEEDKKTQADDATSGSTEPQSDNSTKDTPANNEMNSSDSSSSSSHSTPSSSSSSTYQGIYDTYSARLRSECPTKSMTECAEIVNEGVEKMAEYMWEASGTDGQYETYSSWASKLYDVYMESAR